MNVSNKHLFWIFLLTPTLSFAGPANRVGDLGLAPTLSFEGPVSTVGDLRHKCHNGIQLQDHHERFTNEQELLIGSRDGAYCLGMIHAVRELGRYTVPSTHQHCAPLDVDLDQMMRVVLKVLDAKPESWDNTSPATYVLGLLAETWPCAVPR